MICKTHFSDGDYVKLGRGFPQGFPISVESVDIVYFEYTSSATFFLRERTLSALEPDLERLRTGSRFPSRTLQEAP